MKNSSIDISLKPPIDITWIGKDFDGEKITLKMKAVAISQTSPSHPLFIWASEDGETNVNSYVYDYLDNESKKKIDKVINKQ